MEMILVGFQKAFPSYLKHVRKYVAVHGFENIVDIVIYVLVTRNQSNNMSLPTDKALKSNLSNVNAYAMRLVRWLLENREPQLTSYFRYE